MITIDYLRKVLSKERNTMKLSRITDKFYQEASNLYNRMESDELKANHIKRSVFDILNIRLKKIIAYAALNELKPTNMTTPEKELYNRLIEAKLKHSEAIKRKIEKYLNTQSNLLSQ